MLPQASEIHPDRCKMEALDGIKQNSSQNQEVPEASRRTSKGLPDSFGNCRRRNEKFKGLFFFFFHIFPRPDPAGL